jgi:HJR/Mrr/RecB family endonuclease
MKKQKKEIDWMSNNVEWLSNAVVYMPMTLGLCLGAEAFKKEMKRLNVPKKSRPTHMPNVNSAIVHFLESTSGRKNRLALVVLGDVDQLSTVEVHALLTHEAVHVWQEMRDAIGEKEPSSEFEAYAIQNITYSLLQSYESQKK